MATPPRSPCSNLSNTVADCSYNRFFSHMHVISHKTCLCAESYIWAINKQQALLSRSGFKWLQRQFTASRRTGWKKAICNMKYSTQFVAWLTLMILNLRHWDTTHVGQRGETCTVKHTETLNSASPEDTRSTDQPYWRVMTGPLPETHFIQRMVRITCLLFCQCIS